MIIVQNPGTYSPSRGRINVVTNSPSSGLTDFKYIYTVKEFDLISGATTSLGEFSCPPAPVTGVGRISIDEVLDSTMTYNFNPFTSSVVAASQSISKYIYNWGFQYEPNIDFVDIISYIGPNAWLGVQTFSPYDIQAGDKLTLQLDNMSLTPQYAGDCTVVSVTTIFGWQYVEINKTFAAAVGARSGTINKLKRPIQGTSSTYYAYNGQRQYDQNSVNFSNTHVFYWNNNAVSALTNYKDGYTVSNWPPTQTEFNERTKSVYMTNYETLSMMFDNHSGIGGGFRFQINTFDSNRNILATFSGVTSTYFPSSAYKRYDFPIGPRNIIEAGWITNWTNVRYYTLRFQRVVGDEPPFSYPEKYIKYYRVDGTCDNPFQENYRLAFLNKHGGFDYWNFPWKSTGRVNVSKTKWRRTLPYNYTTGARQDSILSVKSTQGYTVTSDYLNEYDYLFLNELIETTEAYLMDETTKTYYPIIINTESLNNDIDLTQRLQVAEIDFQMAYDRTTHRG